MARKIFLVSNDSGFCTFVEASALMFSKLNRLITISKFTFDNVFGFPGTEVDFIIIDAENNTTAAMDYLESIRNSISDEQKVILLIGCENIKSKEHFFKNGCHIVMDKSEFICSINSILQF